MICDSCALASQAVGKSPVGMGIAAFCLAAATLVYILPAAISHLSKLDDEKDSP